MTSPAAPAAAPTLRSGTLTRTALDLLAADRRRGLTTAQLARLAGQPPARPQLRRLARALREAEAAGLTARTGTAPAERGGTPPNLWVITPAGRTALARARRRQAMPAWAGDAEQRARAGQPVAVIARAHRASHARVRAVLDHRGVPHGRTALPPWAADAKAMYEAGYSAAQAGQRHGTSHTTVLRYLRKQGTQVRDHKQAARARRQHAGPPPR